jgi:hypothetical protein
MSTTLNSTILSVTRRTTKGFTVGEIYDRVQMKVLEQGRTVPPYNSVRARVYELAATGRLMANDVRKDSVSGRTATTFVRYF